ncbi:RNA polymerase sigma factor [Roseomonas sp. GCM10028921]
MRDRHAMLARHGESLNRYARALAGDLDVAKDLWQETAARYLAARRAPAEETEARFYLFRILRNLLVDEARHRRVTLAHVEAEGALNCGAGHHTHALIAEITVRQALARLPPEQREVVGLVDIGGFGYVEAAGILGVPVGTVMSRLARARAAMLADIAGTAMLPVRRRAS